MDLSIVISSYNNSYKLRLVLKYLALQNGMPTKKIQIIVVDDYSADNTSEVALEFKNNNQSFDVKIIRNEKNKGLAASRNIGAKASDSDLIMFLDNDIIMGHDTILHHMNLHKNDVSKKKIVMSKISDVNKENFDYIIQRLEESDVLDEEFLKNNLSEGMDPYFSLREKILSNTKVSGNTIWIFGACFCISMRKEVWKQVGGFDEHFFGWGPEDIEFNFRAYKKGFKLIYCGKAKCYHLDNNKKDRSKLVREITRNSKYFYKKHPVREVQSYLKFYKGSMSYEELNDFLNEKSFREDNYSELNTIGIIKFLTSKIS